MKNVVSFFCDEMRQDALGCYGNPAGKMKTPNIDSIAAMGTLYENCYCNSPICVPSRVSLLTGLYPEDTAVYGNEAAYPGFRLPEEVVTFPEVLAQAGYKTANFGKTHVAPQMHPFQLDVPDGSEMSLGLTRQEMQNLPRVKPRQGISMNVASLYPEEKTDYYPETVTRNAAAWLQEQSASPQPFFLRVSYTQPHSPIILKRGYEELYRDYPFDSSLPDISGLSDFEKALAEAVRLDTLTSEERRMAKVYYYGMAAWVDDQVGAILQCLQELNLLENTILIFNADHGALRGECRGLGKHIFHRSSHAVPLIIADPSGTPKGRRVRQVCSNIDIARTVLSMVGVPVPAQFRGCSLAQEEYPEAIFSTIGYGEPDSYAFPNRRLGCLPGGRGWPRRSCIRTNDYRLDMNVRIDGLPAAEEDEDLFFVDVRACPAEDRNMAKLPQYAPVVASLRAQLKAHAAHSREVPPESLHAPSGISSDQ